MMEEENNNYTTNERQKQQQVDLPDGQVEVISKFLLECPEAAISVHQYLQKNYSTQHQQVIQQNNATPNSKRRYPPDDSGGSVNFGSSRRKHARKKSQQSAHNTVHDVQQHSSPPQGDVQQMSNRNMNQHKRLSFEQLKHAVSSNLPCFHVEFAPEADRSSVPSALQASDLILKELQKKGVKINRFTLVGWVGKKLKLGVNNKEDYANLVSTENWPEKINGVDIVVINPKYNPDSFALVARYVPGELEEDFVVNEIQRTIASAERIKRIHYAYQRRTNDYRFDVKEYQEYNAALQLGRIAIGHSWVSITPFFPGNKLTFCTKCWCIGHLRNKCNEAAKCRVCLETLTGNQSHVCKNEPRCAQCDGNHHSLDNQCQIIRDYKNQLKKEVEDAIEKGTLHRAAPKAQAAQFELQEKDFPALSTAENHPRMKWNIVQGHTTNQMNFTNLSETEKSLDSINSKLSDLLDSNKRVESRVNLLTAELKTVSLDTQLHQAVLSDIINIMSDFIQHFLPASLTSNKVERCNLIPATHQFHHRFRAAATRLCVGSNLNRNVVFSPAAASQNVFVPMNGSPVLSASIAKATSETVNSSNNAIQIIK